jgi:hypothetical protein
MTRTGFIQSLHPQKRPSLSYILLEVIVSMVILGVAIAALLRSFTVSLASAKRAQIITIACLLAQQVLDEFEVVPPQDSHAEGNFLPDEPGGYQGEGSPARSSSMLKYFYFTVDVEEEEVDYPDMTLEGELEEFENLTKMAVAIIYDDGRLKRFTPVKVETYLTSTEKFTFSSKNDNKLF